MSSCHQLIDSSSWYISITLSISHAHHVITLNICAESYQFLREARVTLKLNTFHILTNTIDYLSHVIRPRQIAIVTHKMEAIKRLKPSTNIIKLCKFLRPRNVSHHFLSIFEGIAASLNRKLRKDQQTQFDALSADELNMIYELQNKLLSLPILALQSAENRYIL